ncbi:22241_t:CDS:2, partial [Gigaspora rosea]
AALNCLVRFFYDGLRPDIPKHVPELVAKLITKCWDTQPGKRPSSKEIYDTINTWYNEILGDKSTEIIAQIKMADEVLESNISISNDYNVIIKEDQVKQNSKSLLITDCMSQDDVIVHEHIQKAIEIE